MSTKVLSKAQARCGYRADFDKPSISSDLDSASMFGIDEIVVDFVEVEGCDINKKYCSVVLYTSGVGS